MLELFSRNPSQLLSLISMNSALFISSITQSVTYSIDLNFLLTRNIESLILRLPPIEAILEVLLTKTKAEEKLKDEALILVSDVTT